MYFECCRQYYDIIIISTQGINGNRWCLLYLENKIIVHYGRMVDDMKILENAVMPNGTEIVLEDWSDKNTKEYPDLHGLTIGAYPVAKNTGKFRWIEGGQTFRISISMNQHAGYTNDNVKADFEALKSGEKNLEDLAAHFWNGEKDMWYLGMNVEYKGW